MGTLSFDGSQVGTPVGFYTYTVKEDQWSWSDGVFELHGYAPRSVAATTELMLRHKHPDDMARAFEVLETAVHDGEPFSCYHRIIDADGKIRSVLSVGHGAKGQDGRVEQLTGYFVDLTEARRAEVQLEVDEALRRIAETRSVIDQAKGIIMAAVGCDATEAFGVLRHHSSHQNVKLNELARQLVDAVRGRPNLEQRSPVFGLLDRSESPSPTPG
jgi:hypothetical protein